MTPRVERSTILLTFAGVIVITGVAKSLASYDPSVVWSRFTLVATLTWLSLVLFLERLRRAHAANARGALSLATWVTLARGLLIALVAGFVPGPVPAGGARWLPGGLYALAALADGADGALADLLPETTDDLPIT